MGKTQYRLVNEEFDPEVPLTPVSFYNGDGSNRIFPQEGEGGGGTGWDPLAAEEIQIGADSILNGEDSFVVGQGAEAGTGTVAIGPRVKAGGASNSVAIGKDATVDNARYRSVVVGANSRAVREASVVIGADSQSNSPGQVIIGDNLGDIFGSNRGAIKVQSLEVVQSSGSTVLILHSPNGSRFSIGVNDSGVLSATAL